MHSNAANFKPICFCRGAARVDIFIFRLSQKKIYFFNTRISNNLLTNKIYCPCQHETMLCEQEEALITYMEHHSRLAQNKFMGMNGVQQRQDMWTQLALLLNALGPVKDVQSWQQVCILFHIIYLPTLPVEISIISCYTRCGLYIYTVAT